MKRLYADFLTGLVPVRVIKGSATFDEFFRRWYVDVIVTRDGGGYPWGGCSDAQYRKGEKLGVRADSIVESAGRGKVRTVWREDWLPVKRTTGATRKTIYTLWWVSEDQQGSLHGGDYASEQEAWDAQPEVADEFRSECGGDPAGIDAGTWSVEKHTR